MMDIIQCMDDPQLFAPHFKGKSGTWGPWRTFLRTLFGLTLSPEELELFEACTGRASAPTVAFLEAAIICGRRAGKSRVLATIAVFLACFRSYEQYLAPGEVATIAIIASDRKQARAIFRYILGLLQSIELLSPLIQDFTADSITLTNRVVIEIATASFRVTRGYTFVAVLADESAFWRSDTGANPSVEIFRALRPGLATIPGAMLISASSPYRKQGELYNSYRRHFGNLEAKVLVWQAPTLVMNPSLPPSIVAEAYEIDPESAKAEYGAQFRDDISDFVSREAVEACTATGRLELPPMPGTVFVAFCDPSGGSSDSMTLSISHNRDGIAVLDCVRECRPPFSPEDVVEQFSNTLKAYNITEITGDRWGGEFVREPFRKRGITYNLSEQPKSEIYTNTLPLLNARMCELLDLPRLQAQLCGLERRTARSGRDSIDHATGQHDDVSNSVCGSLLLATSGGHRSYDRTMNWVADYSQIFDF